MNEYSWRNLSLWQSPPAGACVSLNTWDMSWDVGSLPLSFAPVYSKHFVSLPRWGMGIRPGSACRYILEPKWNYLVTASMWWSRLCSLWNMIKKEKENISWLCLGRRQVAICQKELPTYLQERKGECGNIKGGCWFPSTKGVRPVLPGRISNVHFETLPGYTAAGQNEQKLKETGGSVSCTFVSC